MSEQNNTPAAQDSNRSTLTDGAGNAISTPAGEEAVTSGGEFNVVIGDQTFTSQEDLTKAWDSGALRGGAGADSITGGGTEASTEGTAGQDTLKGAAGNDVVRTDDEIKASLKEAGGIYADPKYEPFALEFEKTGQLSPESITKAAADFGISEDFVKEFVKGQTALKATAGQPAAADVALASALTEVAPDEKTYNDILEWGRENLTAKEQSAYNSALDRKDGTTAATLLAGFKAKWAADGNGKGPRDVTSEGSTASGQGATAATGYASMEEQKAAQRDPRYDKDPAYRAEVERKIGASNF